MCPRVHQEDETKLKATVKLAAGSEIEVTQDTAADLKATVTQAAKDRTITGTATVTPSGDMARKLYYDRNPILTPKSYHVGAVGFHTETVRWTYTVPNNKKAMHSIFYGYIRVDIGIAGRLAYVLWAVKRYGDAWYSIGQLFHAYGEGYSHSLTVTVMFVFSEGDAIRSSTYNSDSPTTHGFDAASLLTEFDE